MDFFDDNGRPNPAAVAASLPLRAFTRLLTLGKADTRALAAALASYSVAGIVLAELWVRGIIASAAFVALPVAGRAVTGIARGTGLLRLAMSATSWTAPFASGSSSARRTLGALAAFDGAVCALFLGLAAAKLADPLAVPSPAASSAGSNGWAQHQPPWMWVFISLWAGSAAVAVLAWLANARQRRRAHRSASSPCAGFRGEAAIYTAQALLTLLFLPLALQLSKAEAALHAGLSEETTGHLPLPWASIVLPWVALPAALGVSSLILLVSLLGTGLNEEAAREAGMESTPEAVLVGILSPSPMRSCAVLSACLWLFGLAAAMVLCLLALEMHLRDMSRASALAAALASTAASNAAAGSGAAATTTVANAVAASALEVFSAAQEPQPAARLLMRIGAIFAGFTASIGGYHVLGPLMEHVREQAVREHVDAVHAIKARIRCEPPAHLVRVGDGVFRRLHQHTEALQRIASVPSRCSGPIALTAGGAPLPGEQSTVIASNAATGAAGPAAPASSTSSHHGGPTVAAPAQGLQPGLQHPQVAAPAQGSARSVSATSRNSIGIGPIVAGSSSELGTVAGGVAAECLICCSCSADAVLLECGHGGVCFACARRILALVDASRRSCPLCRLRVTYAAQVRPLRETDRFVLVSLCVTPRMRRWSSCCEEELSLLESCDSLSIAAGPKPGAAGALAGGLVASPVAAPAESACAVRSASRPRKRSLSGGEAERAALLAQSLHPGRIPVAVCARDCTPTGAAQAELGAGLSIHTAQSQAAAAELPAAAALRTSLAPWISADSGCTCQLVPLQPFAALSAAGLPLQHLSHPPPPFARRFASTARCRRVHQSDSAIRRVAAATDEAALQRLYGSYWAGVSVMSPHVGSVLYWLGAAVAQLARRCCCRGRRARPDAEIGVGTLQQSMASNAASSSAAEATAKGAASGELAAAATEASKSAAGMPSPAAAGITALQSAPWAGIAAEVLEVLAVAGNPADAALSPSETELQVHAAPAAPLRVVPVAVAGVSAGSTGSTGIEMPPAATGVSATAMQRGNGANGDAGAGSGTGLAASAVAAPIRTARLSEVHAGVHGSSDGDEADADSEDARTPAGAEYSPTAFTGLAAAAAAAAAAAGIHV